MNQPEDNRVFKSCGKSQVLRNTHSCLRWPCVTACLSCQNSFKQRLPLLFPLHRRCESMHVGHLASRVTFILYLCKGYGVVHNDLSSFINVLFQTGSLKKHSKWHFPSSQKRDTQVSDHVPQFSLFHTHVYACLGRAFNALTQWHRVQRWLPVNSSWSFAPRPQDLMRTTVITQLSLVYKS